MSKIKLGWSFLKGMLLPGTSVFESVMDYLLGLLNTLLARDDVSSRVKEIHEIAAAVMKYVNLLGGFCPEKWKDAFAATVAAVQSVLDAVADTQVTAAEVEAAAAAFREAYAKWMED